MSEKTIESLQIKRLDILDEKGEADMSLMPSLSDATVKSLYECVVLSRTFDHYALSLQREGRLGTYASFLGQEASQVGSACALEKIDWIFPSFRESAVHIAMGYPIQMLLSYWAGDERGAKTPDTMNIFPICIPVGTQIPHAVGAAMGAKYRKDKIAVVAYFGDGGSSKGDFHEGLNLAGVYKLPAVFICQNNQWAISVPRERQTSSKTIAQKAFAYGFEGMQVDGNDIFAVYKATKLAVEKARQGGGPSLIECFTYRIADHTTADDATRYRTKNEVELWKTRDPLLRLTLFMKKQGLWTEQYSREVEEKSISVVTDAIKQEELAERPRPSDMFTYTYESMTPRQKKQMGDFGYDAP